MSDKVPVWLEALIEKQTASITGAISQQLSSIISDQASESSVNSVKLKSAKTKCSDLCDAVPAKKARTHDVEDDGDEFDRRFGHLFNLDVNNNVHNSDSDGDGSDVVSDKLDEIVDESGTAAAGASAAGSSAAGASTAGALDDDDAVSVDDDLVDGSGQAENWDLSSSIAQFLVSNVDKSLTDEFLTQISHSFIPKDKFLAMFTAPKMPKRLFTILHRMKSKAAAKTERALFNAQTQLLVVAKPIINAISVLKPLGKDVSEAREMLGVSLRGMFSVSLAISKARRENVRFLFKPALADVLYDHEPTHLSLFGGTSFVSQIEKASKEAKLDLTWGKKKDAKQPFRSQPGFPSQRGPGRFQDYRYGRGYFSGNRSSSNYNQKKRGSSGRQYQKKRSSQSN